MRHYILCSLIALTSFGTNAQSRDSTGTFGFALNASIDGEFYAVRIVPSVTYMTGKHQFELGVGFNVSNRKFQKLLSAESSYKYFPNGTKNKFNMYILTCFSYVYNARETYYPTNYNYLLLNGGYGIQVKAFKGAYVGTNVSAGVLTYSKKSEIPYEAFESKKLFDEFRFNLAFQFNVGYRF